MRRGFRFIVFSLCISLGGSKCLQAQTNHTHPKNEIVPEVVICVGGKVDFSPTSGPYDLMGGRYAVGYSVGLRYRHRLGADERTLLGLGVEYMRLPFTFTWEVNAKEVYGIERESGQETYLAERMGLGVLWGTLERELTESKNPIALFFGLGLGWSEADFYPIFGFNTVSPYDDPRTSYVLYDITSDHRNGWVPLLRIGVGKEWCYKNLNRLGLTAFVQWSEVDDFNYGTYVAYPGTTSESRGTWQQGLNYVGLKFHYAMSYGPPKVPKLQKLPNDY
jgi:hypothetical protein